MSSERASPGLGAQLRASAHEPEDPAAADLRARLRHKMFGVGSRPPAPSPIAVPVEPRFEAPAPRLMMLGSLAWMLPCLAVVAWAAIMAWQRRAPAEIPERAKPTRLSALVTSDLVQPERSATPSERGPALLDAAQRDPDVATRRLAEASAVQASWADAASPRRIEATLRTASALREAGELEQALLLLRAVLDDLELRTSSITGRVQLLTEIARVYDALRRPRAARATRAEARRLGGG